MIANLSEKKGHRIFILGGKEGVPEKAASKLRSIHPGSQIVGHYSPPYAPLEEMNHEEINSRIVESRPDILLVAFGSPKQELWIDRWGSILKIPVCIGVGGSIDFLAGEQVRAPEAFKHTGMEWLWRMCTDPRRLAPRYARNAQFLASEVYHILSHRLAHPAQFGESRHSLSELVILRAENDAVIIDFKDIDSLNFQQVGEIVKTLRVLNKCDIPYKLVNIPDETMRVLELVRLNNLLFES